MKKISAETVFEYVKSQEGLVSKRDIIKKFKLKEEQRILLKQCLTDLKDNNLLKGNRSGYQISPSALNIDNLDFKHEDIEVNSRERKRKSKSFFNTESSVSTGEKRSKRIEKSLLLLRIKELSTSAKKVYCEIFTDEATDVKQEITIDNNGLTVVKGDLVLANLLKGHAGKLLDISIIRKVFYITEFDTIYGIKNNDNDLTLLDKRFRDWQIRGNNQEGYANNLFVKGVVLAADKERKILDYQIVATIGSSDDNRVISLLCAKKAGLSTEFSRAVLDELSGLRRLSLNGRDDLRAIPFVTIDGEDAKDFDDAVYAVADDRSDNKGGYRIAVAIADVAYYVRTGSRLDLEALGRGNSVYFSDKVIPMLPEFISNGVCSLKEGEDRACLVVFITLDSNGEIVSHEFKRGLMNSVARLTYRQFQEALDGKYDDKTLVLKDDVVKPLYEAFKLLEKARVRREPLAISSEEYRVLFDENYEIKGIDRRKEHVSNRLIEEFMICANVVAAKTLAKSDLIGIYRMHETPNEEKMEAFSTVLKGFSLKVPFRLKEISPSVFNNILLSSRDSVYFTIINMLVLRSQMQARYSSESSYHFGLQLEYYTHFTSPIRRYSDLLVHRSLLRVLGLEIDGDGLSKEQEQEIPEIANDISILERNAISAERESNDRFIAKYMSERCGSCFEGVISGISNAGLFVLLEEFGCEGFIHVRSLPYDFYIYDDIKKLFKGRRTNIVFQLGQRINIEVRDIDLVTGGLNFMVLLEEYKDVSKKKIDKKKSRKKRKAQRSSEGEKKRHLEK